MPEVSTIEVPTEIKEETFVKAEETAKPEKPQPSELPKLFEEPALKYLDSETAEKVASWSRGWFEEVYETRKPEDIENGTAFGRSVEQKIADLVGEKPAFREGSQIFLQELIGFTREKADIAFGQGGGKLGNFVATIQKGLFSYSPCIASNLSLDQLILTTAAANRVPEAQGWFGTTMVGEAVYELSFCRKETIQALVETFSKRPLETQLDVIHQLQTIGADAIANGDWAEPGLYNVRGIIRGMKKENNSPIVGYAADLAMERLGQEERKPSLGVLRSYGNRAEGRLFDAPEKELVARHLRLAGQVNPDVELKAGGTILPIATDAVGIYDHSNLLRLIGKVELASLPKPSPISIDALRNAYAAIGDRRHRYPDTLTEIVSFVNQRVLIPDTSIGQGDFAKMGEEWSKISPVLSKEQWEKFLTLVYKTVDLRRGDPRLISLAHSLSQNYEKLSSDVQHYLTKVEERLVQKLVPVHFWPHESLTQNKELNPFVRTGDANLPLLLQHLHRPALRQKIEKDLGISLTGLPLRSQIHFLRFLAKQDREGFDRVRDIVRRCPNISNKILGSFLAAAEDLKHGETVLQLAESLDEKSADAVFSKYLEIAKETEKVRENLFERFGRKGDKEQIEKIVQGLLRRGNSLLGELLKQTQESKGKGIDIAESGILEQLGEVRSEVILFAATFKVASAEYPISFEDVKDTQFQSKDSADLAAEEKEKMIRMFRSNRTDYPPKLQEITLAEFREALNTPGKKILFSHSPRRVGFFYSF